MSANILCKCCENYSLAEHTTLKIGGLARKVFFPETTDELINVRDYLNSKNEKAIVVGAGSNLLVSSQGVSDAVIFTKNINFFEDLGEGMLKVGSGMKSVQLAKLAQERNLTGLEFLIGIPGSVGGAVTMNSSAHGQMIKDVIVSVDVMDLTTGSITTLDKEDLELDYRSSFVQNNKHVIISATFKLENGDRNKIDELMTFHVDYRKQNHPPLTEPSAGSTFRNPEPGVFVGKLFQDLGLKGYVEGGAKISEKHSNFIINTGNASSVDVSRLMHRMHSGVKEKYGYDLIAEIRYIGDMTEEEEEIWKNFQVH